MIDVQNLALSYGERELFKGISFQLGDKDKICLAGPNGAGKTTLLRLLCGESRPDGGAIIRSRDVKVGYLRQHLGEDGGATVYEAALSAFKDALEIAKELDVLQHALEHHNPSHEEIDRLAHLQDELIRSGFYAMESETRTILAGLGFSPAEQDAPLGNMSGGWRMRVALARVLLSHPTCLFLDEPTNHLDLESIVWLEGYIRAYSGSLILISHDRQFVDRTCDRILEIQNGNLAFYPLPYAKYEEEKTVRHEQLMREYKKQQDEIAGLERFVERFKAKASKATQAQSKQKQLDKIDRIEIPSSNSTIRLRFPEAAPSGQWVFEADMLAKRYGDHQVFTDGKFGIQAGEKAVLVGPNGAGKTTLLKLLLNVEKPTSGTITIGANVQIGYFAQYEEPTPREAELSLVAYLAETHPRIGEQQLRAILGSMLFSDDDAFKKFGILSGGERARVRLCRLLLKNCNVLILDEPTNHLDMDSKTLLMKALSGFSGTVLFVSHDRYFVENVATRVILVKEGRITEYPGDYAYYLHKLQSDNRDPQDQKAAGRSSDRNANREAKRNPPKSAQAAARQEASRPAANESKPSPSASVSAPVPAPGSGGGQSEWEARKEAEKRKRKAEKRWAEVEKEIAGLDARVLAIDTELYNPETYENVDLHTRLNKEKKAAEETLAKLYRELETLEPETRG